jgi:hypothetical protein
MTTAAAALQPRTDRITRWLLIAIGIYSGLLVTLLNVVVLSSDKAKDRAIFLMADGLILAWIIVGGSLTPMLCRCLVPRLAAIPLDWRVRFVLLCTAMALLEEVITTTMTNLAPLLGTATTVKPGTILLHSRADETVPFADSEELVRNSGLPLESLIEVGTEHRLADPESLARMLEVVERVR